MDTHHYLWSLITICLYPSKIWWYPPLSQVETLCATPSTSWATLSARHSQGEATEDQGRHGVTQDGDLSGGVEPMQRNEQNDNLLSYLSYFIKLVKMNIQMLFLLHLRDMYPLVNEQLDPENHRHFSWKFFQPLSGRVELFIYWRLDIFSPTHWRFHPWNLRDTTFGRPDGWWPMESPNGQVPLTFLGLGMGLEIYTQDL